MKRESINTGRLLAWEDEAPAEIRDRRIAQGVSAQGRARPSAPARLGGASRRSGQAETSIPDGDPLIHSGGDHFGVSGRDRPSRPWWRPSSTVGRVFLGLGTLVVLGAVATGVYFLKVYIERDARFRIAGSGNIETTGLTEVSRDQMLPVFGEDIGRNIFFVNLNDRRRQLEEIPWVERATVMRLLPDRIRVAVAERQPVAFARQGQEIGLVDANGVLLTMPAAAMAEHHYSFPVVTGIDPRDPLASRKARMAVYERLLAELDAGGQHLSEQISEIDLTDPEDARVLMPEQGADILAHFGVDHFLERYQRYKAHIAEWRQQYPRLAAVDLRYDRQVVLEMAPGSSDVTATVSGDAASNPDDSAAETAEHNQARQKAGVSKAARPGKLSHGRPAIKLKKKDEKHSQKRAAFNVNRYMPAPTTRPAAAEGQ